MKTYYFTFGYGYRLRNCYTTVEAADFNEARKIMAHHHGNRWAFQYDSAEAAGVDRFGLQHVPVHAANWRLDD